LFEFVFKGFDALQYQVGHLGKILWFGAGGVIGVLAYFLCIYFLSKPCYWFDFFPSRSTWITRLFSL
jgi:hypothetical protein